jgi:predicted esterase
MSKARILRVASGLLLTAFACVPLARADYVFMSDGQVLKGRVLREGDLIRDPIGGVIWSPKIGGFFLVDDEVRRVVISPRQVAEARRDPPEKQERLESYRFKPSLRVLPQSPIAREIRMEKVSPWKTDGSRVVEASGLPVSAGQTARVVRQWLTELNPRFFRVGGETVRWHPVYHTSEIDMKVALQIVRQEASKRGESEGETERSALRFALQANWLDEAESILADLDKRFAEVAQEKAKTDDLRKDHQRLLGTHKQREFELAFGAGAHAQAERILAGFNGEGATEKVLTALHAARLRYKERNANLQATRKLLESVRKEAKMLGALPAFGPALAEIERDLNLDTLPRLDAFLSLARQEERNRARGKPAELQPEQLLALAISGWLLGNAGAEASIPAATRLWQTREFLLNYLQTPFSTDRQTLLTTYERGEALPVDVITLLIELLPSPPLAGPRPQEVMELNTRPDDKERGTQYLVQLPPEYHPHRSYPLLIVLPNVRETMQLMHGRWAALAAQHGYILATPRWTDLVATEYEHSDREHLAVLETLRDVKRQFNVDSGRVFLFGFDWSGTMAYDVGMAYPDLFAGIVPMLGRPAKPFIQHRHNVQYLPIYAIEGEKNFKGPEENRNIFEQWVQRGFPCMYVEYTGRGHEFYQAELPFIFDWMGRKKRAAGLPELGKATSLGPVLGQDFTATRGTTARFYWLSSDDYASPGRFTARIAEPNVIVVQTASTVRQLTVWLSAGMVDFGQPIEVRLNPHSTSMQRTFKKRLEPSLKVMLEDFYVRRDKKSLFVGRVDFAPR